HALVGGVAGAAITKGGWAVITPAGGVPLFGFIVLSPLIGFWLGSFDMRVVGGLFRHMGRGEAATLFWRLEVLSAAIYSLGYGGNDAQKTMGVIVMVLNAGGLSAWATGGPRLHGGHHGIALWIILLCNFAIALGTMFGGWRIVKTMGQKITQLLPVGGLCAETAAAITIIGATCGHVPI